MADLATDKSLEPEINPLIEIYQKEYPKHFSICNRNALDINLSVDILSLTPALKKRSHGFPEIHGLILRLGECDGNDVKSIFKSELILKTSIQVNRMLHDLLPLFTNTHRNLILS